MASIAISSEERSAFFGTFERDASGNEHLLGLTAAETVTFLLFRRKTLKGKSVASGKAEHAALGDNHIRACRLRQIEPGELPSQHAGSSLESRPVRLRSRGRFASGSGWLGAFARGLLLGLLLVLLLLLGYFALSLFE